MHAAIRTMSVRGVGRCDRATCVHTCACPLRYMRSVRFLSVTESCKSKGSCRGLFACALSWVEILWAFVSRPLRPLRGSKRTPTTSFRFRVSRVTPAEPRSDSRTRRRSKIARKTCVLQIAFSAPRLRRPNSSGSPQNASEPGRQSGTRPGAVLGSWYATTSNAAARETPRHQGTAVWQAGLRE
jgi:hypothetical protein